METTAERIGRNEALFREVNERIREVSESFRAVTGANGLEFVCECSRTDCHVAVEMDLGDYEGIRADPTRFLVSPGHVWNAGAERVVEECERYWVVEKVGAAADVAEDADPRA